MRSLSMESETDKIYGENYIIQAFFVFVFEINFLKVLLCFSVSTFHQENQHKEFKSLNKVR